MSATPDVARPPASTRFLVILALIVLAGFGLRVVYVLAVTRHEPASHEYDADYYQRQARSIATGFGFFDDPFTQAREHRHEPAADHPPLTVIALVPAAAIDDLGSSRLAMRFTMVVIGTGTIALIGLLTRQLAGDAAGLVAAGIAALDPNLWVNDGLVMSEALSVLLTVALLSIVFHVLRRGASWYSVAALGAVSALGILTRAEFVLYVPFLVLPALWIAARGDRGRAVRFGAVACAIALLVLSPWIAFNLSRFEKPTLLSTNEGVALAAANCDGMYYGSHIGWVDTGPFCAAARADQEQSVWNAQNRTKAFDYMADHLDRIPVVALARLGRTFTVWRVGQSAEFATGEGRPEWVTWLGAVTIWVLVPLAVGGAVVLRRRREPIWPLMVPIATTCFAIALWAGGLLRYRVATEPSFVILAAVGVVAIFTHLGGRDPEHAPRRQPVSEAVGE